MKNIKVNGVQFRGQFGEAIERMLQGNTITMEDFKNGDWEPTVKVSRFQKLLKDAKINYKNLGESLRSFHAELINKDKPFYTKNN